MTLPNIIWWVLFIFIGLMMQAYLSGIDVLVVGFVLLLQDRDLIQLLWIAPCLLFLQEGMGSLDFGTALLWYASIATMYYMGCFLLESSSVFFMILLGVGVGISNATLTLLMSSLQYHTIDTRSLVYEAIVQGLLVPCLWVILKKTRLWVAYDANDY